MIIKLAFRNLLGAGLRTWLNVLVLSLSYVVIIGTQGMYVGMNNQASKVRIDSELGGGQYWHQDYDPYDPFSLEDAHGSVASFQTKTKATPVLIRPGTIYPDGRLQPVLFKGIDPAQTLLDFPTAALATTDVAIPLLIGKRMATKTRLAVGDSITLRWRDADGTFDAGDAWVVHIMETDAVSIDDGQLWLPLERLRAMSELPDEATLLVVAPGEAGPPVSGWVFHDLDFLLKDLRQLVRMKSKGASFLYILLLFMAGLGIFNAQILAIFRRIREIGTLIALGMTRAKVVSLFTLEGCLNAVLAAAVGAIYGLPLLTLAQLKGIPLPQMSQEAGFALGTVLYPKYSLALVLGTTCLIFLTVTLVSYIPARRVSKLEPTEAIRGKR